MKYRYHWFSTGTIQVRTKVQLYLSSGHDSAANRSTLILGEIAAMVDKNLGPTLVLEYPVKTYLAFPASDLEY